MTNCKYHDNFLMFMLQCLSHRRTFRQRLTWRHPVWHYPNTGYTVSHDTANHQKANLEHANDLSKLMFKIYSEQFDSEATSKWPESNCALKNSALSRKYSDCCTSANTVIGASCAATLREVGLEPFRAAASSMGPAVEETCKLRAKMVTDFDSYRRRLKSLESKKLATEVGLSPFYASHHIEYPLLRLALPQKSSLSLSIHWI